MTDSEKIGRVLDAARAVLESVDRPRYLIMVENGKLSPEDVERINSMTREMGIGAAREEAARLSGGDRRVVVRDVEVAPSFEIDYLRDALRDLDAPGIEVVGAEGFEFDRVEVRAGVPVEEVPPTAEFVEVAPGVLRRRTDAEAEGVRVVERCSKCPLSPANAFHYCYAGALTDIPGEACRLPYVVARVAR